ncbi:uncharacterized protein LOC143031524 [Oratosquilla oratoria]|uniref:uncharacterized protein LOC143031524 n=1 Tax=Oratosquilla oratoria TaxID=337810 RepID=UPI003F75B629
MILCFCQPALLHLLFLPTQKPRFPTGPPQIVLEERLTRSKMDSTVSKLVSDDLNQWGRDDKSFLKQTHKTDVPPKAHIKLEPFQSDTYKDYCVAQQDSPTLENTDMTFKEEKILFCDICHLTFATIDEFECHGNVCVQKKSSQRDQSLNSTLSGSTGVMDDHCCKEEEMQYNCPQCKMAFYQKGDLDDHIKKTHTKGKPHKCTFCHAAISRLRDLKAHMRIHTGEKPFKCSLCVASFRKSGHLKSHMRTHTGEKPHECGLCGAAFSQASSLKSHIRTHTGEKPYECEQCGAAFTEAGKLRKHFRKHTREKARGKTDDGTGPKLVNDDLNHWRRDDKSFLKQNHKTDAPPKTCIKSEQFQSNTCKDYSGSQQDSPTQENTDMTLKEEKILFCDICHLAFATLDEFECHGKVCIQKSSQRDQSFNSTLSGSTAVMDDHCCKEKEMQYNCTQCNIAFYQKGDLQDHIKKSHTEDRPHKCTFCHAAFSQPGHLEAHIRLHTGEKPYYKCSLCIASFRESGQLKSHMQTHTDEKPHKCDLCGSGFSETGQLYTHIRTHTSEKPHKCELCGATFSEAGSLRRHFRVHTGEKAHECTACGASFPRVDTLKRHMETHKDKSEKPHKCSFCGAAFSQRTGLKYHLQKHTDEKPYECDQYDSTVSQSATFKSHMQTRTVKKTYKCGVCGAGFTSTSNLRNHITKHTGEKPHKCEQCGAAFTEAGSLRRHFKVHTGEKAHECTACGAAFSRADTLKRHMETHSQIIL